MIDLTRDRLRLLRWITAGLAIVRVGISIRHFLVAWLLHLGLLSAEGDSIRLILLNLPATQMTAWTVYMLCYGLTAYFLFRGQRWAIVSASIAFLADFGFWAALVIMPAYDSVYDFNFTIGDILINSLAMLVLLGSLTLNLLPKFTR